MFFILKNHYFRNSEDTVLLVLKEVYALFGIAPVIPGGETSSKSRVGPPPKGPPPMGGASPNRPPGLPSSSSMPRVPSQSSLPGSGYGLDARDGPGAHMNYGLPPASQGPPPQMFNPGTMPHMASVPVSGPPQIVSMGVAPPSGPPPFSAGHMPSFPASAPAGPPPMSGFKKKS